jgi:ribosomal protein L37AE/L43A
MDACVINGENTPQDNGGTINHCSFSQRRKLPHCPTCLTKATRKESNTKFFCKNCSTSFEAPTVVATSVQYENHLNSPQDVRNIQETQGSPPFVDLNKKGDFVVYHNRRKTNKTLSNYSGKLSSTTTNSVNKENYDNNNDNGKPWSSRRKNKRVLQARVDGNSKRNKANENNDDSDTEEEEPFDAPAYSYLDALYENNWQKFHDDKLQGVTITMFAKGLFLRKLKQHANKVAAGLPSPVKNSYMTKSKHLDDDFDGTKIRFEY